MVRPRWLLLASLALAPGCAAVRTTGEIISATADTMETVMALPPGEIAAPPPDTNAPVSPPAPRRDAVHQADGPAPPAPVASGPPARSAPRLHVARAGDTMASIADEHGTTVATLEQMNGLTPPYEVREGDVVVLPNANVLVVSREAPADLTPPAPSPPPPAPMRRPRATDAFYMRPVAGEIVSRFGPQADGRRLDGVEIAARDGEAIVAAEDGEVVYAGGDVPGYDNLLLIRHADGGVTAYGYARQLNVREGQRVQRGDTVAVAGARGRILFQARRGTTAIDPAPLLGE